MKTAGSNLQTPIKKPCSLNHYMCHLKNKTKPTVCKNQSPNITNNLISASGVQNMIKKMTPQKRGVPKKHLYILTHPSHLHRC